MLSNAPRDRSRPIRLGIVGLGKIARDQHLPAIRADSGFVLAAAADPNPATGELKVYPSLEAMLAGEPDLDAVSLCTPPQVRHDLARTALAAGKHVLLEKPPCATVAAAQDLAARGAAAGVTLFAAWHSRFAAGVEPARAWLGGRSVAEVEATWKEDVLRWHPGQDWIFEPGGFGVFDPGINALSILTHILPGTMDLQQADLVFPSNKGAPIAADLRFRMSEGGEVRTAFDFRQTGPQIWTIRIRAADGEELMLTDAGARIQGAAGPDTVPEGEYPAMYRTFGDLIGGGRSDVDLSPLVHVADAFMIGKRSETTAFHDPASARA